MRRLILMLLPGVLLAANPTADALAARMREAIQSLDAKIAKDPTPTLRDVTNCALARLTLYGDVAGAQKMLRFAWSHQVMDAAAPDYGNIPWRAGHPEIQDANGIEFASQAIGPILVHYGEKLGAEFRAESLPHVKGAIAAVRRHKVKVSYTNIYLMKTVNLILMGEAIQDHSVAREGYDMLREWIAYTNEMGIHEFLSPTYYSVDLNSLQMGYLYAAGEGAKEQFRRALDYFWLDIVGNYFSGAQDLGGAHSRDYDFLRGTGGLLVAMSMEGLRTRHDIPQFDFEKVFMLESELNHGYHPPADILALNKISPRVVAGKYDTEPNRDRYNFINPSLSVGSANGDYGPQDKMVNIELASTKERFPAITIVPDTFDEPYGLARRKDRSGHSKPVHLPLHPTIVQYMGDLLVLLDLDLSKVTDPVIATNIILPAEADQIRLDGKKVKLKAGFSRNLKPNTIVGLLEGQGGVAIRIFTSGAELKLDEAGMKNKAARVKIVHAKGDAHVRVGILIMTAFCKGEPSFEHLLSRAAESTVQEHADEHTWKVTADSGHSKFGAVCDLDKHRTLERTVGGNPVKIESLQVNGKRQAL